MRRGLHLSITFGFEQEKLQLGANVILKVHRVFEGVTNSMKIAREEIFGPVMSVISFKTEDEAIAMANDSSYGLQASVWSHDINRAHRVARALKAGTVHVNQYDEDDITVPFGGFKQSGNGRDKSLHAFDKVTELKTTWIRIDAE